MGDRNWCRTCRDFAAADGEDDKAVAVRGALCAGSAGLRICRADCESGAGVEVVSSSTRASDGRRLLGTWFGWSGCTAASELFDSHVWLATCIRNHRACADGSVTSGGNLDYSVDPGRLWPAAGWRIPRYLSERSDRRHNVERRSGSHGNDKLLVDSAGLDISDRRHRIGHSALHLVFERPRLFGDGGIALFHGSAGGELGWKNSRWVRGGSRPEEECDGTFLFSDGSVGAFAQNGKSARGGVDVRFSFRIFDGGRLHACSVGHGREFWNGFAWQAACVDHHGILAGAMGTAVGCGKAV